MAPALVQNKRARPLPAVGNDGALPTELLLEVLLRLLADELCRLRLVCRSWRSLTSEPHFATAHASRHPLVAGVHRASSELRLMDLSGNVVKRIRVPEDVSCLRLSSQLGMVCIDVSQSNNREKEITCARVLSTATGTSTVLPDDKPIDHNNLDHIGPSSFILGYVPSTEEFKVFHMQVRKGWRISGDNHGHQIFSNYLTFDVMTIGNGDGERWRRVKQPPPFKPESMSGCIKVVDGIAYFLIDNDKDFIGDSTAIKPYIVCFDLAIEEWRSEKIQCPLGIHLASTYKNILCNTYRDMVRLERLDGCLVTVVEKSQDCCSMDLWFLVDVEKCIWTKRYSVQSTFHLGWPLMVLDDRRVVISDGPSLKVYDTRTRRWEHLASTRGCFYIHKYEGNLLQLRSSVSLGPA